MTKTKKVMEIGAMLFTGIAALSILIDYFYVPANLKLLALITGIIGMVLYMITNGEDLE